MEVGWGCLILLLLIARSIMTVTESLSSERRELKLSSSEKGLGVEALHIPELKLPFLESLSLESRELKLSSCEEGLGAKALHL